MTAAAAEPHIDLDPFWAEVRDFLDRHGIERSRTIAPLEFGAHLSGTIPYERAGETGWGAIGAIVVHKGWIGQLSPAFLNGMLRNLLPAFANPVFVVYCRDLEEPLASPDHVKAFLEKIPEPAGAVNEPEAKPRPLLVYTGNRRMICRDPEYRKIVVPSESTAVIGALMAGRNLIADLRGIIRPVAASARKIIDFGAGIGLFAMATRQVMSEDCVFQLLETDEESINCLVANIDLAGLYWHTEFLTSRPAKLQNLAKGATGRRKKFRWVETKVPIDLDRPTDVMHIDLDFGLGKRIADLAEFVASNGHPALVLSQGLTNRRTNAAETGPEAIEKQLRSLGYRTIAQGDAATDFFARITILRRAK